MHSRAFMFLAEQDPAQGSVPESGIHLSRDELERELAELEAAVAKAEANLELAEIDRRRWGHLLERARKLALDLPADHRARLAADREVRDLEGMARTSGQRVEGCRAALEALDRVHLTVRDRLLRAHGHARPPRRSGTTRRHG